MLPAVVLSAQVTINGIVEANAKLSSMQGNLDKVTASAEAAGASVDETGRKLDALRAKTSVPIVQEIKIRVDDSELRNISTTAAVAGGAAGGGRGGGAGLGFLGGALWGHGGGPRGPWGMRLLLGGGLLAGAGTVGSFAGFGAEHLLFTGLGLAGSAGAGALGGGLLAAGAAGQMAVGGGSDLAVIKSTIADTKTLGTAYSKVTQAVAKYGAFSKQAKEANQELNLTMQELGNTAGVKAELGLAKRTEQLNKLWDKKTGPARVQAVHILEQGVGLGETFVPKVAHAAAMNLSIVNKDLKPLFAWLQGPEGIGIWQHLEGEFKKNLPTSVHAFSQAMELVLKTVNVASRYTGGFVEMLDKFFTKWNNPKNFSIWEEKIGVLIADFHLWWNLIKVLGRDIYDLFTNDAHTGNAIVLTITHMLEKLGEWERSSHGKEQLHNIFQVHKEEVIALLHLLPPLVRAFSTIYMTVAPPLVEAVTAVLTVVAELLLLLEHKSAIFTWILGLTLIAAKLGLLSPLFRMVKSGIMDFLVQIGLLSASTEQLNAANLDTIAKNTELIASNQAVAASYGEVATAAEATAAASDAGQLSMMMPEAGTAAGSQLSLLGTIPKQSIVTDAEKAAAPAGVMMGESLMGSLARTIGPAAAAYGIINILTSVFSKGKNHLKEAGFEAGGAIIGGIAGFMAGGPVGAMLGVGLGSLGGEMIAKLFEPTKKLSPLQTELEKTAKRVATAYKAQGKAAQELAGSEHRLHEAQTKSKTATQSVHTVESKLAHDRKVFGSDSKRVRTDEVLLTEAKHKNAAATKQLTNMQKLNGFQLELYKHTATETVGADKERIQSLHESVNSLTDQAERLKHNNASWAERKPVIEQLATKEKGLETITHNLQHVLEESSIKVNPRFARSLDNMNLAQAQFGKHLEGIKRIARESMGGAIHSTLELEETWLNMVNTTDQHTTEWNNVTLKGLQSIMGETNKALGSLGVSKVNFHTESGGKAKRAMGGIVVPGSGTGDKVPLTAMVEPGEVVHVLNRRAVADMTKLGHLEQINSEHPRFGFQKGGNSGGYVYPFGPGITWGRIDEGQDMGGSGTIAAIGDARIAGQGQPGWPGTNQGFFYELLNGPRAHEFIYVYENIKRLASIGSEVKAGQAIAELLPAFPHLEMGFSTSSGAPTSQGYYTEGMETQPGKEMHAFLAALAAGGGRAIFSTGGGASGIGGMGAMAPKLKEPILQGPEGSLKELGQASIHKVTKAAQEYLNKHAGGGGGVASGVTGSIESMAAQEAKRAGAPRKATLALFEALWAESSMGTASPGNVLQALEPYTKIRPAAQEISGFLTGHPTWTGTSAIEEVRKNPSMQAYEVAQAVQKSGAGEASSGASNYGAQQARALESMARFGLQEGGTLRGDQAASASKVQKETKKPVPDQVKELRAGEKAFHKGLHEIQKHHASKGLATINKAGRAIKKAEGLKPDFFANVIKDTEAFQEAGEFATNAAELTRPLTAKQEAENAKLEEEGKLTIEPTPGKFRGMTQIEWLTKELGALGKLRNTLIGGAKSIGGPEKEIVKMVKDAHARMRHVVVKIRETERARKEIEKAKKTVEHRIAEIEHSQASNVHQLENEKNTLETDLSKQEGLKQTAAVHAKIENLREQIHGKTIAISAANQEGASGVKALKADIVTDNKKITATTKKLHEFENTKAGIEAFIPIVEERKSNIFATGEALNAGGSYHNKSFSGLKEVQGLNFQDNGTIIPTLSTEPSGLGGNILAVQLQLRELNAPREAIAHSPTSSTNETLKNLELEIGLEYKKKFLALEGQLSVLAGFPTVPQAAAVPHAGGFAMGGLVAATVGENGVETLLMPRGSNVISNAERRSVVAQQGKGGGSLVINHLHIDENGKVTATDQDGRGFPADVKRVTRKQTRRAERNTPGGRY